jgi:hypothetical protein
MNQEATYSQLGQKKHQKKDQQKTQRASKGLPRDQKPQELPRTSEATRKANRGSRSRARIVTRAATDTDTVNKSNYSPCLVGAFFVLIDAVLKNFLNFLRSQFCFYKNYIHTYRCFLNGIVNNKLSTYLCNKHYRPGLAVAGGMGWGLGGWGGGGEK